MSPLLAKYKMGFKIHHHYQSDTARSAMAAMAKATMAKATMAQSAMAQSAMAQSAMAQSAIVALSCKDKFAICLRN